MSRRIHRLRPLSGWIVMIALGASCRTSEPRLSVVPGTYVLTRVDGRVPPATTDSSSYEYGRILGDTLVFSAPNHVRRVVAFRRVIPSLDYDVTSRADGAL